MSTELDEFLQDRESRRCFEEERLILEITEVICRLMNEQHIARAEMAQRLGCSPSNVTQMLDGDNNFTVRSVADFLFELGARLTVAMEPLWATAVATGPVETVPAAKEPVGGIATTPVVEAQRYYRPRAATLYRYSPETTAPSNYVSQAA